MKRFLTLFLIVVVVPLQAQTRWIFYKSHSGCYSSFLKDEMTLLYGPGMAPREYEWKSKEPVPVESDIKIKTKKIGGTEIPIVIVYKEKSYMHFYSNKDSLLGCKRNYKDYLSEGTLLYDVTKQKTYMYLRGANNNLLDVTGFVESWEKRHYIQKKPSHIYTAQYDQVALVYPVVKANIRDQVKKDYRDSLRAVKLQSDSTAIKTPTETNSVNKKSVQKNTSKTSTQSTTGRVELDRKAKKSEKRKQKRKKRKQEKIKKKGACPGCATQNEKEETPVLASYKPNNMLFISGILGVSIFFNLIFFGAKRNK